MKRAVFAFISIISSIEYVGDVPHTYIYLFFLSLQQQQQRRRIQPIHIQQAFIIIFMGTSLLSLNIHVTYKLLRDIF